MCFWVKRGLCQFKFGGELKIFVAKTISFLMKFCTVLSHPLSKFLFYTNFADTYPTLHAYFNSVDVTDESPSDDI
jgi:hypothetical protein